MALIYPNTQPFLKERMCMNVQKEGLGEPLHGLLLADVGSQRRELADLDEAGMDFASVTAPFLIYADRPLTVRVGRVRLVP